MPVGTEAWWDAQERVVRCVACIDRPSIPEDPAQLIGSRGADQAGASARRRYERQANRERAAQEKAIADDLAWRQATIERRPLLGRLQTALKPSPTFGPERQSTTAWRTGAEGEETVALVLDGLPGVEVLHDRRVPRSQANIDHIVVGPSGVFVIDAKKYKAGSAVEIRNVGGWLRPDPRLYVGGRNRTKLVEGVQRQVEVVRAALGPDLLAVPVHGVLCFVDARWGRRHAASTLGVTVTWPLGLPELVARPGPGVLWVEHIAGHLRVVLRPAVR